QFARNLLSWKNSGFSIDNSVCLTDAKSKESLAEYIARPPLSLKKIRYEPSKGKVLFHTKYSDYFKENVHLFDALDFLAELTQHIPPGRVQLIRRYGLYSSRTKGRWSQMPGVAARAPEGWRVSHPPEIPDPEDPGFEPLDDSEEVTVDAR
ncbi:MAG TPA: transposase, partial [Spirochaetia bacterium]|nr:transposase [Spirochaetia bacterium]